MSEEQSGDCQACMRRATALARSGHAEGCQVAALESELETLRRERDRYKVGLEQVLMAIKKPSLMLYLDDIEDIARAALEPQKEPAN